MPTYMPVIVRNIGDALLQANLSAPNANATTLGAVIDLGAVSPYPTTEGIMLKVVAPAVANLANTTTITITVEDADANLNANFAAVTLVGSKVITGGASGSAATTAHFSLPATIRRFIRVKGVGSANAGTTITEIISAEIVV